MNALTEYIKTHKDWEKELSSDPYNIFIRKSESEGFENMVLFSYNMPKSDMKSPIVQVSRGIILDVSDESNPTIVCHPFDKFFNYNEPNAHDIDWTTASIQEKVDGSIMKLWYNRNLRDWVWSTNGTIDARNTDLPSDIGPVKSFGALAKSCMDSMFSSFPDHILDQEDTYIFEITSPWNRVVVPHDHASLTLLGVRNNETGKEFMVDGYSSSFAIPKRYKFESFNDMEAAATALPFDEEGYVVCDANYRRVKVKSPAYLSVHHLADNGNVSYDRLLTLIQTGEDGEFLGYYPEYTEAFNEVRVKWENHVAMVEKIKLKTVALLASTDSRKDFALEVLKHEKRMQAYFFCLADGKESRLDELMAKTSFDKLFEGSEV